MYGFAIHEQTNLAPLSDDAPHLLTSPELLFCGGHSYGGGLEITLITLQTKIMDRQQSITSFICVLTCDNRIITIL